VTKLVRVLRLISGDFSTATGWQNNCS